MIPLSKMSKSFWIKHLWNNKEFVIKYDEYVSIYVEKTTVQKKIWKLYYIY